MNGARWATFLRVSCEVQEGEMGRRKEEKRRADGTDEASYLNLAGGTAIR